MLIKKSLCQYLSDDDYLIGVVEAQLHDDPVAPRGYHIIKRRISPAHMTEVITNTSIESLTPFQNLCVWDISQNEHLRNYFTICVSTMTDEEFSRLMTIFGIPVGLNDSLPRFSLLNDLEIKIQVALKTLKVQQDTLDEKIQICRLWILSEWSLDQIANHLMIPRRKIETIISTFRERHLPSKLALLIRNFDIRRCLLESVPILLRQFTMSYSEKSLQDIFDSLSQIPDFARLISFSCFKKFMKDDLGICFAKQKTI